MKKGSVIREGLIFLGVLLAGFTVFYISLVYPPFPKPVSFARPGVTRLDMPSSNDELVPDFLTGAIYHRSDIEEVNSKRRRISKAAFLIFAMYPLYLFLRVVWWAANKAIKRRR